MGYVTQSATIAVGKAVKKSLVKNMDDALVDHEDRITDIKNQTNKVEVFKYMVEIHSYNRSETITRLDLFKAVADFSISNVQIYVIHTDAVAPTAGTLEVDLLSGNSMASLGTIFTSKPNVTTFGNGDTNSAPTFVTNGQDIAAGDWIQLDVSSLQTGQTKIYVDIYGILS